MNKSGALKESELRFVTYEVSGSSNGGYYRVELVVDKADKRKVTVTVSEQKANGMKETSNKYKVSADCCLELEQIIGRYGVLKWKDLPPSEFIAYDAATTSVSIWYMSGDVYNISENQALPEKGMEALSEIKECMLRYAGV